MNWPLVSRTAYDAVCSERDRLREQVDRLLEHVTRIDRASLGLPELAPQKKEQVRIPESLRTLVDGFNGSESRRRYRARVFREIAEGDSVEVIEQRIREEIGAEE